MQNLVVRAFACVSLSYFLLVGFVPLSLRFNSSAKSKPTYYNHKDQRSRGAPAKCTFEFMTRWAYFSARRWQG